MRLSSYSLLLLAALAAGPALAADDACSLSSEACVPGSRADPDGPGAAQGGDATGKLTPAPTPPRTADDAARKAAEAAKKLLEEARRRSQAKHPPVPAPGTGTNTSSGTGNANSARQDTLDGNGGANGRAHEQQIAREIIGDDKDAPVSHRVARLHSGGERALEHGVATVAMGITQVSLAEQDRAENGVNDENTQLREIGTQNIAQGARQVEAGRATIDHGNAVARHENKRASVGASNPMPIRPSTFELSRASPETNERLEEMERVAGVPAAALVQAVNSGGREELVSLAGGAKGVSEGASAGISAAIPNFATSEARAPAGGSAPPPANTWSQPSPAASPVAEKKPAAIDRKVASAEPPRSEPEPLQSLGADNLLRSLGAKEIAAAAPTREERSLFQRVSRQYLKRVAELR